MSSLNPRSHRQPAQDTVFLNSLIDWNAQRIFLAFSCTQNNPELVDIAKKLATNISVEKLYEYCSGVQLARMTRKSTEYQMLPTLGSQLEPLIYLYKRNDLHQEAITSRGVEILGGITKLNLHNPDHVVANKFSAKRPSKGELIPLSILYGAVKEAFPDQATWISKEKNFWSAELEQANRLAKQHKVWLQACLEVKKLVFVLRLVASYRIATSESAAKVIYEFQT